MCMHPLLIVREISYLFHPARKTVKLCIENTHKYILSPEYSRDLPCSFGSL